MIDATTPIQMEPLFGREQHMDCTHVGYDFPVRGEHFMVDLWVFIPSKHSEWTIYIRRGHKSYLTDVCYKDEPPTKREFQIIHDAWQEFKARAK